VGYTSSAIPSIREGNSSPFLSRKDQVQIQNETNLQLSPPNFGFLIQDPKLNQNSNISSSEFNNSKTRLNENGETCEFVHLTDNQASWIGNFLH